MKLRKTLTNVLLFGSLLLSGCNSISNSNKNNESNSSVSNTDHSVVTNHSKTTSSSMTGRVVATGVTLDKTTLTVFVGETFELHATVSPSNADFTSVSWQSSDSKIVSVNWLTNRFQAISVGTATITAKTIDGGFTASCVVTVKNMPVSGVTIDKDTITLEEGETHLLYEAVEPLNATDKTVTWSSSDNNVATVDDGGRVTAIKCGEAMVTVTTKDGDFTASCKVIVTEKARYEYMVGETTAEIYTYTPTYGDAKEYIRLVTPLKNTGNRNIYCSSSTYDIEDSNGNVLQSIDSVSCEPTILKPGETAYYYDEVEYTGSIKSGVKAIPHPTIKKATYTKCIRYDVSNVTFNDDRAYGLKALGKITNNTETTSSWIIAAIHVFDKKGDFVITLDASTRKAISPKESISFSASSLNGFLHKDFTANDVGRYEAVAYEWDWAI